MARPEMPSRMETIMPQPCMPIIVLKTAGSRNWRPAAASSTRKMLAMAPPTNSKKIDRTMYWMPITLCE